MNEEEILKLVEDAKQMSANIRDRMERIKGLLGTPKEKVITKTDYLHPKEEPKAFEGETLCEKCGKGTGTKWKRLCMDCWKEANPL